MNQIALIFAGICLIAPLGLASTMCTSGTLAGYEALGAAGCTIGTNTVANFNTPSGITGATPISPGSVDISVSGGSSTPTLTFTTTATATGGALLEALFDYTISGNAYTSDTITMAGTSMAGNGAATYIQNYCLGGSFDSTGFTCATGNTNDLVVLANGNDLANFSPVSTIGVTDDFTLDSGGAGAGNNASGGTVMDAFGTSPVPEPATFWLLSGGFLFGSYLFVKVRIKENKETYHG